MTARSLLRRLDRLDGGPDPRPPKRCPRCGGDVPRFRPPDVEETRRELARQLALPDEELCRQLAETHARAQAEPPMPGSVCPHCCAVQPGWADLVWLWSVPPADLGRLSPEDDERMCRALFAWPPE